MEQESLRAAASREDDDRHGIPLLSQLSALAVGEPYVEVNGLIAGYGGMNVLRGVDLRLGKGQSLCIVGPNGSGKSTLLNAIFQLADVHGGSVSIGGRDFTRASPREMLFEAHAAYVLQKNSLFLDMTVEENLLMACKIRLGRKEASSAVAELYERFPDFSRRRHDYAGTMSGGERRMLEIARAIATRPDLLLVDEPSIGLEPRMIAAVFDVLASMRDSRQKTVIVVEQNVQAGLAFADIGYVLVSGRVALADRSASLLSNPALGRAFIGG